jgi:hypothetical protein
MASGPRDADGEAVKVPPVLVSCEEDQPKKLDSGSGQISDTSSTDTRRSSRRKSFLSSMVTDGFTTRRSMKTAFAERAGTWWRGGTSTGGRWKPPAGPRRALAYEKDDG